MATRYYIFDNQGHEWMTIHNYKGGLTLKEIRDMFCMWGAFRKFCRTRADIKI